MAGDWIKMRIALAEDPAVIGIADALGLDEDTVVGKLHRLWGWADQQTIDGNAPSVTTKWIDRYLSADGFADAMSFVGWLLPSNGGIQIPDFDKHNGESGKRRALTARRAAKCKAKSQGKSNAADVTKSAPREEKRREDKESTTVDSFVDWWELWPVGRKIGRQGAVKAYKAAVKRLKVERSWTSQQCDAFLAERLAAFVVSPCCLGDFCPHPATWLNNGRYDDDPESWNDSGGRGDKTQSRQGRDPRYAD